MGVSEILGILNLVGLLAVAVLLILHLRRRTDGQASTVTPVTPEDLLRSEEKLTGSFRKESEAAVQALRREIGDSRRETGESVQNAVARLGDALRQSQSDAAEAQKQQLADAYESGDPAAVREAQAVLADTIRREAKDIRDKYIDPPNTTDFGILFLPTEGLYAEAVRLGLPEKLRREYHVSIAGPTTLAALLNSLQLGFRTLVIQKRSGEVWKLLGAVKKEFGTFEDALTAAQMRIRQTGEELDKLVGVRTRQINRKLKSVELSSAEETAAILPPDAPGDGEDT